MKNVKNVKTLKLIKLRNYKFIKNMKNITNIKNVMVRMIERTRKITWRVLSLIKTTKRNISAKDKFKRNLFENLSNIKRQMYIAVQNIIY